MEIIWLCRKHYTSINREVETLTIGNFFLETCYYCTEKASYALSSDVFEKYYPIARIQGMDDSKRYAIRFWNNGDKFAAITQWNNDAESSYSAFQNMSFKYDNVELVEEIVHSISARGSEACTRKHPISYYESEKKD